MSSSANGRRKAKRLALRTLGPTTEAKSPVPVDAIGNVMTGRAIVPFVVIEHTRSDGSSLGILVLEQAVA
jgi:hypothetical protein